MTHQMILFASYSLGHKEVAHKFYEFRSKTKEHKIAQKMADEHGVSGFVQMLDGDGYPAGSFTVCNNVLK